MITEVEIRKEALAYADARLPDAIGSDVWNMLIEAFETGVALVMSEMAAPVPDRVNRTLITSQMLENGKSRNGGWSTPQIAALGEDMSQSGWRKRLIGKEVRKSQVDRFLALRNAHLKK